MSDYFKHGICPKCGKHIKVESGGLAYCPYCGWTEEDVKEEEKEAE